MSKNNQEIIKRINDINTELGLTNSPSVGDGSSVSLRQLLEDIKNKLISTNDSDINGKILDIFNKNNNYYNELTSSSTSYMKGKVNDLYTKFNNIYNELNSTSTSYMKGKINSIYNNISSGGMGIKSVQFGTFTAPLHNYVWEFIINHNYVDTRKSFIIINGGASQSNRYQEAVRISSRTSTSFGFRPSYMLEETDTFHMVANTISWQVIEFY